MSWVRTPVADVYVVLDGMGGHAGGAMAAELAEQVLHRHFESLNSLAAAQTALKKAFDEANETVYARGQTGDPATQGMGTTAVALLVAGARIMPAHVGDSRAYLMTRKGQLRGLTKDHSRVQRMIDAGLLTPAQAANHPDAGILERALGHAPRVEVEVGEWRRLRAGDVCLLCSDGLCGYVGETDIANVLGSPRTPQEQADELVRLALEQGGADNVTVQVIRYEGRQRADAWRWFEAMLRPAAAVLAALVLAAVFGLGWLASPPAQVGADQALGSRTAALADAVRRDRELADARYASTVQQLDALHTRLEQLDEKISRADAAGKAQTPHAPKPAPHKGNASHAQRPAAAGAGATVGAAGTAGNAGADVAEAPRKPGAAPLPRRDDTSAEPRS